MMNVVRASTFLFPHNILRMKCMKLGTHMPGGERGKLIDIEDPRTKVKVTSKNREKTNECYPGVNFFVSAQYLKNEMSDLNESWYTHA
jgi:hypothetical protein